MKQTLIVPQSVLVRQEGLRVIVISNERTILDMPWDGALALARAIISQAKLAEEIHKAEEIAIDQGILLRLGVPIGLTSNRTIQNEAKKLAAWDSNLRRYIRGSRASGVNGIRSSEVIGIPSVQNVT